MGSHEDSSTTLLSRTLTTETVDLAIVINLKYVLLESHFMIAWSLETILFHPRSKFISLSHLVVLEDSQLDLPVLVLDLLGGGVVLLLPLLSTSPQPGKKGIMNKLV